MSDVIKLLCSSCGWLGTEAEAEDAAYELDLDVDECCPACKCDALDELAE